MKKTTTNKLPKPAAPKRANVPEQALNLIQLAQASAGAASQVAGTALQVRHIATVCDETLARDTWLLLLSGELIVDLPHHDFRILRVGDALSLPQGLPLSFNPVQPSVILIG